MAAAPPGSLQMHIWHPWRAGREHHPVPAAQPRPPGQSLAVSSLCLPPNHRARASAKALGSCSTRVPAFAQGEEGWKYLCKHLAGGRGFRECKFTVALQPGSVLVTCRVVLGTKPH